MKTLTAVSALALLAGSAQAVTIYSEDFEDAVFDQGGNTFNSDTGWRSTDFTTGTAGTVNELSNIYASHLTGLGDAFGANFGGNTLAADTGINYEANTQYTFSFDHFRRSGGSPAGDAVRAQIQTAAGVVLATEDFAAVTTNASASDIENR
ncbi:MAG: hypothetical protein AAF085_12385, partial [Planctomycetota bacterium]